jgi:hypothetical protein
MKCEKIYTLKTSKIERVQKAYLRDLKMFVIQAFLRLELVSVFQFRDVFSLHVQLYF